MHEILQKLYSEPLMFIGYFSYRIIFVIIVSYFLYYRIFFWLWVYVFLYAINIWIIKLLQKKWRDPRPLNGIEFMENEFRNYEYYGMPSGHTQSVFFSLVFFFMITRSVYWLLLMLFIAVCTISQRLIYRKHTLLQVIIGGLIGSLYGYFTFLSINHYKKNGYLIYNNVSK